MPSSQRRATPRRAIPPSSAGPPPPIPRSWPLSGSPLPTITFLTPLGGPPSASERSGSPGSSTEQAADDRGRQRLRERDRTEVTRQDDLRATAFERLHDLPCHVVRLEHGAPGDRARQEIPLREALGL